METFFVETRMLGWLLQDGLLVLGLIGCVCLFLSLKREMHREARRYEQVLELAVKLRAESPSPLEPAPATLPQPVRSGFNLQKRAQAVRLLRRGEDAAHVSAALDMPRREVELLIRIENLDAASIPSQKKIAALR